jgi:NAD(P)-dependent dehydrogenase (short-subunit alcohol dehydrogenase family)
MGVDVSDGADANRLAAAAVERFGRIDILINNAAMMAELRQSTPFETIDEGEWDRVMAVNVKGPWLCARAVMPVMRRQQKGRIINISSVVTFIGTPLLLHYCVSKGAVIALTRSLSSELAGTGITVNAIAPGLTMTGAIIDTAGKRLQELFDYYVAGQNVKRPEQPGDLVGTAAFLASDDAEFMSGQTLVVDGGFYPH